jgi:hypothetical protein
MFEMVENQIVKQCGDVAVHGAHVNIYMPYKYLRMKSFKGDQARNEISRGTVALYNSIQCAPKLVSFAKVEKKGAGLV